MTPRGCVILVKGQKIGIFTRNVSSKCGPDKRGSHFCPTKELGLLQKIAHTRGHLLQNTKTLEVCKQLLAVLSTSLKKIDQRLRFLRFKTANLKLLITSELNDAFKSDQILSSYQIRKDCESSFSQLAQSGVPIYIHMLSLQTGKDTINWEPQVSGQAR